ncbi:rRNA maturation RNase YbeY [Roseibium sediminicola]|uniref:Endoribonuclease YbeY n=1 Tax=Roseibium sediminicola TaxID=2933272 RepID=A0ABT0GV64_9HYPH|nr:rRNA maturation RNase YbeY [Roseibium sp. CAU 1639]MCK7613326.1 rRNA maturation RNase YbeY [Roseibium sp. CAU 1639]
MPDILPDGFQIDLSIEAGDWDEAVLMILAERAIAAAFAAADLEVLDNTEVSLLFTDDASIRKLNAEWREKDKPTNVLSFPGSDPQGDVYGPLLGDIVFAQETVAREADEMGIEFSDHLSHLIVHGLLHLFDYDHQENDEAELMESLEKAILASIGIDDPYADRPLVADDR